jgi:hypothetical protein
MGNPDNAYEFQKVCVAMLERDVTNISMPELSSERRSVLLQRAFVCYQQAVIQVLPRCIFLQVSDE